jgi:hypothetical protein
MDKVKVEIPLHGIDVEFSGDPVKVDESFGHAFGIEKKIGMTVENITWDKENQSWENNQLITGWLLQEQNLDKVIDLLIQKHKES